MSLLVVFLHFWVFNSPEGLGVKGLISTPPFFALLFRTVVLPGA